MPREGTRQLHSLEEGGYGCSDRGLCLPRDLGFAEYFSRVRSCDELIERVQLCDTSACVWWRGISHFGAHCGFCAACVSGLWPRLLGNVENLATLALWKVTLGCGRHARLSRPHVKGCAAGAPVGPDAVDNYTTHDNGPTNEKHHYVISAGSPRPLHDNESYKW